MTKIKYELGETIIFENWSSQDEDATKIDVPCYVQHIFVNIEFDGRKSYNSHFVYLYGINNKKMFCVRNNVSYKKAKKRNVKILLLEKI